MSNKKYDIRIDTHNIYVSRDFLGYGTISRVVARVDGWEKDIPALKRSILQEARALGLVPRRKRDWLQKLLSIGEEVNKE